MSQPTVPREYREVITDEGLTIVGIRKNCHLVVKVVNALGVESSLVCALTPSDRRSLQNHRRDARRAAKKTTNSPKEG